MTHDFNEENIRIDLSLIKINEAIDSPETAVIDVNPDLFFSKT